MKVFKYLIQSDEGIHARPATLIVSCAKMFKSSITITNNEKSVDGKRMIAIMSLNGKKGEELEIRIEGEDEEEAFDALLKVFKEKL
jgi:phosphotransferase system HPr (HPr) family protein